MPPISKRCLHWLGSTLAIAGIAFVFFRLSDYRTDIDFIRFSWTEWLLLGGLALIYGLSNLMLALAWRNLLQHFGVSTSRQWSVQIYGVSQIAKYVPGNFFHLASRQTMAMTSGVANWPVAKSSVLELILISATGTLFGLLALPFLLPGLAVGISVAAFIAALIIVTALLWCFLNPKVARAFIWHAGFLATSGMLFLILIELLTEGTGGGAPWAPLIGAYTLAWLAGLVTPGAPAGIGVREMVLLVLMKDIVNEADLVSAVVLGRLVTVVGDFLFFALAVLIRRNVE